MKNFVIPSLDKPNLKNPEILSNYLNQSLEAFSDITGVPVTFFAVLLRSSPITIGPAMKYPANSPSMMSGVAMLVRPALHKKMYGSPRREENCPADVRFLRQLLSD